MADVEKDLESADDIALADKMNAGRKQIIAELHKRIIGQDDVIELVLLTLFVGGNSLIVGVPGPGEDAAHRDAGAGARPEVQPHPVHARPDAVGHHRHRHHPGRRGDRPAPDGVRARTDLRNIVLADEINRTPPKTQSALLEAMQEHRVTIQGRTYKLDEPFYVFATQNPIELEGTYPAARSAARSLHVPHRHRASAGRRRIRRRADDDGDHRSALRAAGERRRSRSRSSGWCAACRWPMPVLRYALPLVRTSRPKAQNAPESVKKYVAFGASVRAAQYLVLGAKARALTNGRYHVSFDDIRAMAHPVLRHRVLTNFRAESEGITTDSIIDELLAARAGAEVGNVEA